MIDTYKEIYLWDNQILDLLRDKGMEVPKDKNIYVSVHSNSPVCVKIRWRD